MQDHSGLDSIAAEQEGGASPRVALRTRLLAERDAWCRPSASFELAALQLGRHLREVVDQLEPALLGLYWPQRSEFNAAALFAVDATGAKNGSALALPCARRSPRRLEYRAWDGTAPSERDDHAIPTSAGAAVEPDVVLVPCLGYTRAGYRLGYGGGYFDRWLAVHPAVTAVGVGWTLGELGPGEFVPEAHDVPMALIVSERGVV